MSIVTVVPLIAAYPITHMGHAYDLCDEMSYVSDDYKVIGLSTNNQIYDHGYRSYIFNHQMDYPENIDLFETDAAGKTIVYAYDKIAKTPFKILNLFVGDDRINFAERLKMGLETGTIIEMGNRKFDEVNIITPLFSRSNHGLSGTRMRQAVIDEDLDTFWLHLGKTLFQYEVAKTIMYDIKERGIKVKRSG